MECKASLNGWSGTDTDSTTSDDFTCWQNLSLNMREGRLHLDMVVQHEKFPPSTTWALLDIERTTLTPWASSGYYPECGRLQQNLSVQTWITLMLWWGLIGRLHLVTDPTKSVGRFQRIRFRRFFPKICSEGSWWLRKINARILDTNTSRVHRRRVLESEALPLGTPITQAQVESSRKEPHSHGAGDYDNSYYPSEEVQRDLCPESIVANFAIIPLADYEILNTIRRVKHEFGVDFVSILWLQRWDEWKHTNPQWLPTQKSQLSDAIPKYLSFIHSQIHFFLFGRWIRRSLP